MSEPESSGTVLCGSCAYFKRAGVVQGKCRYYSRVVYPATECLAAGKAEADLPHCQTCGKPMQPSRTARSGSKFCPDCWPAESRRREEERLRWENRYLTLGLELAQSANHGRPARSVAWCTWDQVERREKIEGSGGVGALVGGVVGGIVGELVGAALDSRSNTVAVSYDAMIGLLAVTETEAMCLSMGRYGLGSEPRLNLETIQARSKDEAAPAAMTVSRFPLSGIQPKCTANSVEFGFEGTTRRFTLAEVPEIPHQPSAAAMLAALRDAGAPLPVGELLAVVLSGPPAFNVALWRPVASSDAYWNDLKSAAVPGSLDGQALLSFLSTHASAIPELQDDARFTDLLWILFEGISSQEQQRLAGAWLGQPPRFVNAFIEKARQEAQRGGWLSGRKYKRLETLLTGGLSTG